MSISSDDSDDDFLSAPPIFAKPEKKKPELVPVETLKEILSGKSITATKDEVTNPSKSTSDQKRIQPSKKRKSRESTSKTKSGVDNDDENPRTKRRNDPRWIEAQARKTVEEELGLNVVDTIADLSRIGWYRHSKKGKAVKMYPVVLSKKNNVQARVLLKGKGNNNKRVKIQYIGATYKWALKHQEIAFSNWIPLSECSDSENEKHLQTFLKTIRETKQFKNKLLDLKIEELAVRKMWEKVRSNAEERKRQEQKESTSITASIDAAVHVTQDSDNNSHNSSADGHVIDNKSDFDDYGSDDEDDEEFLDSFEEKEKKGKTPLRINDEIEFYDLLGTFGNPSALRNATVVGVRPDDNKFPIDLSNMSMPLPASHRVRILPDGYWQPIRDFALQQKETESSLERGSGLAQATNMFRSIHKEIRNAADDFWKTSGKHCDGTRTEAKDHEQTVREGDDHIEDKSTESIISRKGRGDVSICESRRLSLRIRSKANLG
mmetsp:Transcript_27552/g.75194  ORF Transcript_27552/g.75194 Transcript_27552/m.75194 type:complete len:491 (-) Transcript_27552:429-1901(-)|eukprot:CAMPEP_0172366704 /NCGR_PEP_ID=MMETSP1060-20121228/16586_1 /TAXON_ID=37318 /ORGANISM="Pseudo-nitzschia pungens, Strain cf. cingulata" /LENGTH=490 /DNA_ID=CAMNT_0013090653 /DNA_START=155 /DNA_END=1627 /DNA_ORIENTATION=-